MIFFFFRKKTYHTRLHFSNTFIHACHGLQFRIATEHQRGFIQCNVKAHLESSRLYKKFSLCHCRKLWISNILNRIHMVYEHFTSYCGSIRFFKVIEFSTDQLIIQKRKLDFSITKPCKYKFEATVFNQERLLYCI